MTTLDSMLERNRDFAASQAAAREPMPRALPNVKAVIIGCADMRVDPAHVLGIKPGEAVVMRNIGGRVTPGLLEQLGMLGRIGEVVGAVPNGGGAFHLIVLQHTNCGITYLAGETAMLTRFFQMPETELKTKAVSDPRAAVAADVAILRTIPALPGEWLVSGLVFDVETGLVEVVVPPARRFGRRVLHKSSASVFVVSHFTLIAALFSWALSVMIQPYSPYRHDVMFHVEH